MRLPELLKSFIDKFVIHFQLDESIIMTFQRENQMLNQVKLYGVKFFRVKMVENEKTRHNFCLIIGFKASLSKSEKM